MDKARENRNNQNTDSSGNNFLRFGTGFIIIFIYVILWLIIGSNFIYLIQSKTFNKYFPYDPSQSPYSSLMKGGSSLLKSYSMNYGWPYNLAEENFLGQWFANTMIGAWSKPRELLNTLFSNLTTIDERILLVFSPLLFSLILLLLPFVGTFTTLFGAFNFGDNSYNQGFFGIVFSVIMLLFGILWLLGGITGSLQSFMFVILTFYPVFTKLGRENIKKVVNKHGTMISLLLGFFIIINALSNLQPFYGVGMLLAFLVIMMKSLF